MTAKRFWAEPYRTTLDSSISAVDGATVQLAETIFFAFARARIDFAWPQSAAPLLPELASETNALIGADLPIETRFTDEDNERRCWKINGFAEVSCGGTHVRSTREVGEIQLKRKNVGQGKERIEIRLAEAA